jgi:phosphopantetheinyl transferase
MPVFFQHQINESTRLGIWKIEETEGYFKGNVPLHRDVTHPRKRLQHLAGRFLLQYLFADFPYELLRIADTRKPYLEDERYHFSISHCGDYAAAIVSRSSRVGIDIEIPVDKLLLIRQKFLTVEEEERMKSWLSGNERLGLTRLWSAKEAVFKWYGNGGLDFRLDMPMWPSESADQAICHFRPGLTQLPVESRQIGELVLSWTS